MHFWLLSSDKNLVQHGWGNGQQGYLCTYLASVEGHIQSLFLQRILETAESILDLALNLVGLAVELQLGIADRFTKLKQYCTPTYRVRLGNYPNRPLSSLATWSGRPPHRKPTTFAGDLLAPSPRQGMPPLKFVLIEATRVKACVPPPAGHAGRQNRGLERLVPIFIEFGASPRRVVE
jgi:hypothetical protein